MPNDGLGTAVPIVVLIVGLIVIVGIGVKFIDMRRKREADAVHLQAQVSDALLREPGLSGLAITPTAHLPWFSGPATIEVTGHAPSPEARAAALAIVEREARRLRPDVNVIDHVTVETPAIARVA